MTPLSKTSPLMKIFTGALVDLPSPSSLSLLWNFGSLLGMCLGIQMLSGIFLAMHYTSDISLAFESVNHINREVNMGWLIRMIHANGASLFFLFLFLHVGRGLYYSSFKMKSTWQIGAIISLMSMATAFMGYVLPWGQMSFWGATVITNLFSAIPYIGNDLLMWIWGGFAVDNATLTRFYAFHFLLPFILSLLVGIHLLCLHQTGSNNPLGLNMNLGKVPFHPYFTTKDLMVYFLVLIVFFLIVLEFPWALGDSENFIPANPLVTPPHIQPEWYFLFAYAILRAIPNKLGGVVALGLSVAVLFFLPLSLNTKFQNLMFYPVSVFLFWCFVMCVLLLTWIGARPVEPPYILTGQILTGLYFMYFSLTGFGQKFWDSLTQP